MSLFFFVSNKASTYGLSPIVLLKSLQVKKKLLLNLGVLVYLNRIFKEKSHRRFVTKGRFS